jgi:hypothetical protein
MLSDIDNKPSGDVNGSSRALLRDVHLAFLNHSGVVRGTLVTAPEPVDLFSASVFIDFL